VLRPGSSFALHRSAGESAGFARWMAYAISRRSGLAQKPHGTTEMSLFQEEFIWRGLRLVHDAPDQINPAVDTCIGYTAVLGAKIFTEMEGIVEEVSHLVFPLQDM